MYESGCVPLVGHGMREIATQRETFWPRGSRFLPVEVLEDLLWRESGRRAPLKQEPPFVRRGVPCPFRHGEDVNKVNIARRLNNECYTTVCHQEMPSYSRLFVSLH